MMRRAGCCAAALAALGCDRATLPPAGEPPMVILAVGLEGGAAIRGSAIGEQNGEFSARPVRPVNMDHAIVRAR